MADQNIWQMDPLPSVVDDTMIPVIATDDDASTNNKMSASQIAQYVSQYISSLTRTAYVGTGAQYAYQSMFQAWDALGSPLNIVVCTDITEDGDIVLNATDSYLSITHAYNVTVDRGDFSFIAADVSRITLKIDGSFATWNRNYTANKASIDFKSSTPNVMIIGIKDLIDSDLSDQSFGTPFIVQAQPPFGGFCEMKNVTLQLNNNGTSTNELIDASLENIVFVCNSGGASDFVLAIEGNSKLNGLRAFGDFSATTTLMTINKSSTYENIWNLASNQISIITQGGHGLNLYGFNNILNIIMIGSESDTICPKVINANNCSFTFQEGNIAGNSSASIVNADIMAVDNSTLTSGNFKFTNCQIPAQLSWTGTGEVVQFTSCNFQQGYSIESPNTVMVNTLAGLSASGSSENIKVDGGNGSLILATQGNADFDDPTIGTDDVQQGFNKVIT